MLLNVTRKDAQVLAKRALKMSSSKEIVDFLADSLEHAEVSKLLRVASPQRFAKSARLTI
jgi:hypothetical protein